LDRLNKAATADWVESLRRASAEDRIWLRIVRRGVAGISRDQLSRETGLCEEALGTRIAQWTLKGRLHLIGEQRLLTREALDMARNTVAREFDRWSRTTPAGIKRSEFKSQMYLDPEIVDDALQWLEQDRQMRVVGEFLLPSNADAASVGDRGALAAVAAGFERAGVTPPSPDELAVRLGITPPEMRRLITALLRANTLVRLGSDSLCIDRSALEQLAEKVRALRGQTLDILSFKQLAGVSRKYAIPLLEYLDRQRITVKRGDKRFVL
jgi:selenocysteine-specific elongation factor